LNINGTVSSVDPLLASFFSVGDSMTSSFTYESSVGTPLSCQPGFCAFDAVTGYTFTVGGTSGVGSRGRVDLDTLGPSHTISFLAELPGAITPGLPGWTSDREFVVSLTDSTGTRLIDQFTLPTTVNLADFDSNRWFLGFSRTSDGQFAFVNGTVPVPDMFWPTLLVMVVIVLWKERRRRTNARTRNALFKQSCYYTVVRPSSHL
jgi:hypothetical protein